MTTHNDNKKTTRTKRAKALARLGLAAAAIYAAPTLIGLTAPAQASGGGFFGGFGGGSGGGMGGGSGVIQAATDPTAVQECGECHMPYSPRYLPTGSWQQIVGNLQNHFGEDASLDDQTTRQLMAYYVGSAGGQGNGALRITETRWWTSEHRGEIGFWNTGFGRGKGKSVSNCDSCHTVVGAGGYAGAMGNNARSWNSRW